MSRDDADGATMGFRTGAEHIAWLERQRAREIAASTPAPTAAATQPAATKQIARWQQRVLEERRELAERLGKLCVFLGSTPIEALGEQGPLLVEQAKHMRSYLRALDLRIALF